MLQRAQNMQSDVTETRRPGPTEYAFDPYRTDGPRESVEYRLPIVLRELGAALGAGGKVLDAGCGNGALCKVLADHYAVYGIDLSESGIELARTSCPAGRFRVASVYDDFTRLFGETFDAVVSLEVIEHLYAPREFLRRVREALVPRGLLLVSTPYHGYVKNLAIALAGGCDEHYRPLADGGDIKFWSKKTYARLLTECGFRVRYIVGVGRFWPLWKSMIAVAHKAD